jgi:hypothetical protein
VRCCGAAPTIEISAQCQSARLVIGCAEHGELLIGRIGLTIIHESITRLPALDTMLIAERAPMIIPNHDLYKGLGLLIMAAEPENSGTQDAISLGQEAQMNSVSVRKQNGRRGWRYSRVQPPP